MEFLDTLIDFLLNFYGATPYWVVYGILLLCGFGLPIPEDITLFAGGLLTYFGVCDPIIMVGVGLAGVLCGDSAMYFLGARYGRKLSTRGWFQKILPEARLKMASDQFRKKGSGKILFAARFMPGLRAPMFFSAGMLHVSFWRFLMWDGLAAILSVPAIIYAVYYGGDKLDLVLTWVKKVEGGVFILILLVIALLVAKWQWKKRRKPAV
ncbi:MAG: DedA family protein [Proteobacteria bacterium]|nr:MAG: DedA family protein [Pseudomonadota bacterium]